ncbi:hypothetical protein AGABI1DRAFT_132832 [Agaricus bisporus var. burnettii JB137-S8]|uniref:Uncharacterized protein n=1 Tax=Agaricus bisporus var. burnettii (strain JB137-S8 / ATCC MYA-4627 / FGSC 10392) TaxID=597362 RepID=K5XK25_AGABU|nr:uncharacterized protein AGABI1DRAFT_132832 [Agaricus bisporus var. burnettii JB137-S8]EKM74860.1 hypothetical protein AGABI1DRAFT_132832 [Agaricus bisporus var. burnettii JB137-S8]
MSLSSTSIDLQFSELGGAVATGIIIFATIAEYPHHLEQCFTSHVDDRRGNFCGPTASIYILKALRAKVISSGVLSTDVYLGWPIHVPIT